ncbi:MAG: DUF6768 family protein [Planctomycetota bacterium]
MNRIDELLESTLADAGPPQAEETDTLRQEIADAFNRTPRSLVAMLLIDMVLAGGMFLLSIVMMFRADDLRWTVIWAASAVFFGVASGFLKLWLFLRANRNRVLREVKRLELALTLLANRDTKPDPST